MRARYASVLREVLEVGVEATDHGRVGAVLLLLEGENPAQLFSRIGHARLLFSVQKADAQCARAAMNAEHGAKSRYLYVNVGERLLQPLSQGVCVPGIRCISHRRLHCPSV